MKTALARLHRTSLLRLAPAFFVALIPFRVLDNAFLESKYRLRGPLRPDETTRIVTLSVGDADEHARFQKALGRLAMDRCVWIASAPHEPIPGCKTIDVSREFTPEDVLATVSRALGTTVSPSSLLYYGRLRDLPTVEADAAVARANQTLAPARAVIIVDEHLARVVPIDSPIGRLDQREIALNAALNALEARPLVRLSDAGRWSVSIGMTLLAIFVLYSYPAVLTLVTVFILGATQFALSVLLFDRLNIELPLATSWAAMLSVVLLGLGDRLDRRERREWAVEQEAEALKSLDEMRNNFLSLVSHDLKTPIARILSLLDRFVRGEFGPVTPPQSQALEKIVSTSGYLQRTISTLLLLSRIESGDFAIHRVPADLTELIESVLKAHQAPAAERNIRIEKEWEPLFLIDLDRELVGQVIANLIENALKYSAPGSVVQVRCGESENCPELQPPQPGVWFEIQDNGPGIPRADRGRVLERFVRGSTESTAADQSVKGTGLGLYLCKFFVEKHGGALSLAAKTAGETLTPGDLGYDYFSQQASGTLIRVTLPIEAPVIEVG